MLFCREQVVCQRFTTFNNQLAHLHLWCFKVKGVVVFLTYQNHLRYQWFSFYYGACDFPHVFWFSGAVFQSVETLFEIPSYPYASFMKLVRRWRLRCNTGFCGPLLLFGFRNFSKKLSSYQRIPEHGALIWDSCVEPVCLAMKAAHSSVEPGVTKADVLLGERNATDVWSACRAAGFSIFNVNFSICFFLLGSQMRILGFISFKKKWALFELRPKCLSLLSKRTAFTMVTR